MKVVWISLIIGIFALGVATATGLFPVKKWMRYWFPRLWPREDPEAARISTNTAELVLNEVRTMLNAYFRSETFRESLQEAVRRVLADQAGPLGPLGRNSTLESTARVTPGFEEDPSNDAAAVQGMTDG